MIKKTLFIFGVLLFGFFNFSFASFDLSGYSYIGDTNEYYLAGSYGYNISDKLEFRTDLGNVHSNSFFWPSSSYGSDYYENYSWLNGKLYYVGGKANQEPFVQGYIDKWCITSDWPGVVDGVNGCIFDKSFDEVLTYNSSFSSYLFEHVGYTSPSWANGSLMLCFFDGRLYYCASCGIFSAYGCPSGLITGNAFLGSLNFPNIASTQWGISPFLGGSSSSSSIINSQITGDYSYYDCTWNDIFIALGTEGYNKNICYGGLDNFDLYDSSINYNPIPGQGLSISQIWAWDGSRAWDTFSDWFVFWNGLYKDSTNNYNAMWESYPAVYRTYFQLYNTYKGSVLDPRTVLEYCQAVNTFTGVSLNKSAGGYFKKSCEKVVQEKQTGVWQYRLDGTIYSGGVYTGDTPISVNWSGVGTMSGLNEQKDGLNFIQDFFNLAKSKIDTVYADGYVLGILPNYIVVFLLAIILFRFLSH